jgi:hypothetical protein
MNMKTAALLLALIATGIALLDDARTFRLKLDQAAAGELPQGWKSAQTGTGKGSVWQVVEDAEAPGGKTLAQVSAEGAGSFYNLCIAEDSYFTDIDATFKVKAIAGKEDQGGGLVWRYRDADNYYIARWNPLEDNYRFYKVVDGKRSPPFASAKFSAPAGEWHTIRIVCQGAQTRCYFNGKLWIDEKDATFKDGGKIGFWTKADAQTRFADLEVTGK